MKNGSAKRKVMLYPQRRLIEIAPGEKCVPLPKEEIPEIAIARMQPVGDGTYRPVLITHEPLIPVSLAAKLLHVPYYIPRRLARAGFIEIIEATPGRHVLNLASWFKHLEAVRADPDFWSREKNQRRYREAV
jgi:hypothetical protein